MPYPKVISEETEEGANKFTATLFELENAALAFFNETGHLRLGTLSVAIPPAERELSSLTSVLLGDRNTVLSQVLAEQLATALGKIVLASIFLKESYETAAGPILLRLAKRLVDRIKSGAKE